MPEYLFVYGTLLPELAPPELRFLLSQTRRVAGGWLRGELYDLGPYPGAILEADGVIRGEILELPHPDMLLPRLDVYEDFDPTDLAGSLFLRLGSVVNLDTGEALDCWVYAYNRNPVGAALVPDGDYRRHRQQC